MWLGKAAVTKLGTIPDVHVFKATYIHDLFQSLLLSSLKPGKML